MSSCANLSFSFTTNLTLMTDEIADYLASVPGMNIVLSIDGPEDIHNASRVYADEKASFKDVMNGLQRLSDALKRHPDNHVGIVVNSVFAPPYTTHKLDRINNFFVALEQLPSYTSIRIFYPSPGTLPESFVSENEIIGDPSSKNPLVEWLVEKSQNDISSDKQKIYINLLFMTFFHEFIIVCFCKSHILYFIKMGAVFLGNGASMLRLKGNIRCVRE